MTRKKKKKQEEDNCDDHDRHDRHDKDYDECEEVYDRCGQDSSDREYLEATLYLVRKVVIKVIEIDNAVTQINETVSEISLAIEKLEAGGGLTQADKDALVNATVSLKVASDNLALVNKP